MKTNSTIQDLGLPKHFVTEFFPFFASIFYSSAKDDIQLTKNLVLLDQPKPSHSYSHSTSKTNGPPSTSNYFTLFPYHFEELSRCLLPSVVCRLETIESDMVLVHSSLYLSPTQYLRLLEMYPHSYSLAAEGNTPWPEQMTFHLNNLVESWAMFQSAYPDGLKYRPISFKLPSISTLPSANGGQLQLTTSSLPFCRELYGNYLLSFPNGHESRDTTKRPLSPNAFLACVVLFANAKTTIQKNAKPTDETDLENHQLSTDENDGETYHESSSKSFSPFSSFLPFPSSTDALSHQFHSFERKSERALCLLAGHYYSSSDLETAFHQTFQAIQNQIQHIQKLLYTTLYFSISSQIVFLKAKQHTKILGTQHEESFAMKTSSAA